MIVLMLVQNHVFRCPHTHCMKIMPSAHMNHKYAQERKVLREPKAHRQSHKNAFAKAKSQSSLISRNEREREEECFHVCFSDLGFHVCSVLSDEAGWKRKTKSLFFAMMAQLTNQSLGATNGLQTTRLKTNEYAKATPDCDQTVSTRTRKNTIASQSAST